MDWVTGHWSGGNRIEGASTVIDPSLGYSLREKMAALAVDWRNAYLGFNAQGKPCAWPESAAELAGVSAIVAGPELLVHTPLEALREAPSHHAQLLSEVRMGEILQHILTHGDWFLVASEDGYVSWLRSWSCRPLAPGERDDLLSGRTGLIKPSLTSFKTEQGYPLALVGGTPLLRVEELASDSPELSAELVDGTRGTLARAVVRAEPLSPEISCLVPEARQYLGAPYRWGGKSALGVDCSGYVQLVAHTCGYFLPRDAVQQARCGKAVSVRLDAWEPGDLVFFHEPVDHVAFYAGEGAILHARGRVQEQEFELVDELMQSVVGVRRLDVTDRLTHESLWSWIA